MAKNVFKRPLFCISFEELDPWCLSYRVYNKNQILTSVVFEFSIALFY
jgi:hypothetical protein